MNKDIVYKATSAQAMQMTLSTTSASFQACLKSDTGIISNLLHTKILKRNGTFETHLAPKAKQNRFHHQMVNNKKSISYMGGSKRCNFMFRGKT